MKRNELLKSKEYWISKIQIGLFNALKNYSLNKGLNRTELAKEMGVSKGYISQILNGDFDHKISKMVEMSLFAGVVPNIYFEPIDQYIKDEKDGLIHNYAPRRTDNIILNFTEKNYIELQDEQETKSYSEYTTSKEYSSIQY